MNNQTLVSDSNLESIISLIITDLKNKITNKDISLPYTTQLNKSNTLKINGDGTMYLSNNGTYVNLGNITKSNLDINEIYKIFSIINLGERWDNTGILGLPTARWGLTSQSYNGKIYCIGGYNGTTYYNNMDIYDIVSNTWTTGAVMPTAKAYFGGALYNGKIYCIGGWNNSDMNKVEIYDIASNTWTTGSVMPINNWSFACTQYNGKIYCIGGYHGSTINSLYI